MNIALANTVLACLCAWSPWTVALDMDIFKTDRDVSRTAIKDVDSLTWSCEVGFVPALLTLEEMIERVLCHDPKLRQAWANAKTQAALVGVKQSAYLPRLNGNSGITSGRNDTEYELRGEYSRHGHQRQLENRLSLSWVLFDFGRREAALRNARQLLIAANANQDRQLQQAFVLTAQLYYDTLAAQGSQIAASKVAALAAENLNAASAKYAAGAAALSDRLQAQTAYSQASLNEVRSTGVLRNAKGLIALRMGLPPQTSLELAGSLSRRPDTLFIKSVDDLLEQARQDHPSLIAAKAKLDAAKAAIDESRAVGRPTLSFIANISDVRTNQPMDYNGDSRMRDNSVGLQLNIPLFEGFERAYQVRGAQAQFEASEAELSDVEQRISLELWANYQTLSIETRSLERTAEWVDQSNQALQVVQGRYSSGAGNMIELLNALNAYAAAEQQHINTLNSWQLARLKLAASLGRLGFWAL
ncbi:TolC family protein [Pseudomonas sp. Irchel s3b2]|uniref:TolC family protein n=1 Tax=Pseudomonas sp. Irchel s3b2 TaxID=2009073 RepID=UPI000BA40136